MCGAAHAPHKNGSGCSAVGPREGERGSSGPALRPEQEGRDARRSHGGETSRAMVERREGREKGRRGALQEGGGRRRPSLAGDCRVGWTASGRD